MGRGMSTMAFKNPYLLVYLPVSLGTASQRAQAPPGVACPYNFPAVLDLPLPGPVCCWHSRWSKWPGCRLFSCSGGCWGKSGGWVEAGTYGEERGNLHPHMAVLWGITCPSMD